MQRIWLYNGMDGGKTVSRAFVDDDAPDATLDEAPEIKLPVPAGSRNYVTPEGAAALAEELTRLELEELPRLQVEIEKASRDATGTDRLAALRRESARAYRRAEYLGRMAAIAETVHAPDGGYTRVAFGATVTVRDADGMERRYRIVGVDEADPDSGLIGWRSPIARALMGRQPGDRTTAHLPESELVLTVVALE